MEKNKNISVLRVILAFLTVVCLFAALPAQKISAASFKTPIVDKSSITLYPSGCLKSITITVQAAGTYATAYGRIGVHTGKTSYNWNNRFITSTSSNPCTSWPAESEFVRRDATFVAFASGNEFLWSDGKANTIAFTFADGKVDLSKNQTYYLYLWTRAASYGIYTDAELGTLKTEDGKLMDGSGNTLVESEPHVHTLVLEPAKAETCTENGNTAYYRCAECIHVFADENGNTPTTLEAVTIGSLGHLMSDATCEAAPKCTRQDCGYEEGEALGHLMSNATCEAAPKCTRQDCGYEEGEALGHLMSDATCEAAPKCTRQDCGYEEGEALGHLMSDATCEAAPKCTRQDCGYEEGEALGHLMGDATCGAAPKCTRQDCEYEEGEALGHLMGDATCEAASKCTRQDCAYEEGEALGHLMSDATCEAASKCTRQGCKYEVGAALGHLVGSATCEAAPKCTRPGCKYEIGAARGHSMSGATCEAASHCTRPGCDYEEGNALGHRLLEATCQDKRICAICGNAYGEVDSTNHTGGTEIRNAKEATCIAEGYTGDTHCKGCGEILANGTATKATGGHHYGEWKVVKEATKTAVGEKQRTCSVCGHAESEEIPMLSDNPETGDGSNIMLYSAVSVMALAALVALRLDSKKRKLTSERV